MLQWMKIIINEPIFNHIFSTVTVWAFCHQECRYGRVTTSNADKSGVSCSSSQRLR